MAQYIPEKHMVVYRKDDDATNPLAFMVPYGTDTAYEKRVATARSWAKRRTNENPKEDLFDNKPMKNFEIVKNVSRWSTSNVAWRIVDPRGFELEIYSDNMNYIISNTTIVNGVVQDEMQWVRDGSYNYLLPVNSDKYIDYSNTTAVITQNVKLSSFNIGDVVRHEEQEYVFLGRISTINFSMYNDGLIYPYYAYVFLYKPKDNHRRKEYLHVVKSSWKGVHKVGETDIDEATAIKKIYKLDASVIYAQHGKFKGTFAFEFTPAVGKNQINNLGSVYVDKITDTEYVMYNISKYAYNGKKPDVYAYSVLRSKNGALEKQGNGVTLYTDRRSFDLSYERRYGFLYNSVMTYEKFEKSLDEGKLMGVTCVVDGKPMIVRG